MSFKGLIWRHKISCNLFRDKILTWVSHKKKTYQTKSKPKENKKIERTYPKNFTQPIFVKKSYLYRGTPPLIRIKNKRQKTSLMVKGNTLLLVYADVKVTGAALNRSSRVLSTKQLRWIKSPKGSFATSHIKNNTS